MALSVTPFVNNNNGDDNKYILEHFSLKVHNTYEGQEQRITPLLILSNAKLGW